MESFTYRDDGKLTAWEVHGKKDLHRMEYDYHPDGSLKEEIVLFNGETIAHEHYHRTNGMLTGIFDGEGRGHIYEENTSRSERKKIAAILSQSGTPTPFRPSGQPIEEITRWNGGLPDSGTGLEGEDLEWHYDGLGRFTGLKREGLMLDSRQYDLLGRLVYREETPGRGYEFTYDARGRLSSVEGPDGEVIEERSYNTQTGELQTVRDPRNGSETSYLFDSMGRLSKVIDPEGHSVSYKYDSYGRLVALTDQVGETWQREYDALGQMTATIDPLGRRYEYGYDGLGQVREVETPLGVAYQYLYDSLGRLREMNKGGDKTVMSYDLSGNLTLRQLPTGRMETYRYNGLNHLIEYLPSSSVDASVVYRYLRRNDGLLTRETDPLGRQRTYHYDGQGRLIEEINQQNVSQHFAYNNQGEMTERRDFENNRHQFSYDDWGRVTQRLYNSQVEASYEYDTQGNLTRAVNEINGDALEYGYDRKGNLTSQKTAMGTTRYNYDGRGLKTREVRPNQIIDYSYDGRGNLISSKESLLARRKVTYEYNALGQETLRNISGGHIEQRHYDEWGRLKGITGHQIQYEKLIGPLLYGESYVYGPGDQKKFSTDLDGNITAYEYDGFDRLASVSYPYDTGKVYTDFEERLDLGLYPNGQGKPVRVYEEKIKEIMAQAREKYPDYKAANIDLESHLFAAPGGTVFRPWRGINPSEDDALEESYSDVFGVRRTRPQMVSYAWQEEFDYDDAGSRIQKRNGWGTIDYQYSEENRLRLAGKREYLHDKNGNLIQESSGGGLRRYEYNSQNRISQAIMNEGMARLLEYKYDGLGRRTEMSDSLSGTTRYGYEGLGLNPVEEDFERRFNIKSSLEEHRNNFKQGEAQPRESRGRGRYMPYPGERRTSQKTPSRGLAFSVSETRSYLYKGLSPVASTAVGDKGGMRSEAYGHDALGSVTEVVTYGMRQASYRYDAFGKTYEGALSSGERGYNGKPYNAVTGHYNYGYRDYDPMTGRFATEDPIRDGMNWYVYTENDPVNHIDPWGLATEDGGSGDGDSTEDTDSTKYVDFWRLKAQRDVNQDQKEMWDVYAIASGEVITKKIGDDNAYGNRIYIKHSDGSVTMSAHLDSVVDISVGDKVTGGSKIGVMGSTGTDNKHLHVSYFEPGVTSYNPENASDGAEFISKNYRPANTKVSNKYGSKHHHDSLEGGHEGTDYSGKESNLVDNWQDTSR